MRKGGSEGELEEGWVGVFDSVCEDVSEGICMCEGMYV